MSVQISLQDHALSFFGCILRSTIARSYGNSIFDFSSNCHLLPIVGISFTFPPAVYKGSNFSMSCQYFLSVLRIAIQIDVRWYVIVVLVCIFLIINNTGHLFMCFFFFLLFVYLLWSYVDSCPLPKFCCCCFRVDVPFVEL